MPLKRFAVSGKTKLQDTVFRHVRSHGGGNNIAKQSFIGPAPSGAVEALLA
jgi:hypothetical protein